MAGSHRRLGPPQQVHTSCDAALEQREPAEPPVGQQHHARLEPVDQIRGQGVLRGGVGPDLGVEDGMGAALGDRDQPSLRERGPLAPAHPGTAEPLVIRRRVGDVEARPVDRGQPPSRQPRPRRAGGRQRLRDPPEQRPHRLSTQTLPCLEDRRLRRQRNRLGAARPRQSVSHQPQHILIGPLGVQRHAHREVSHHPRRQRPMPLLGAATPSDHLIDQFRRERATQHAHRHQIRQPPVRLGLAPPRARHPPNHTIQP